MKSLFQSPYRNYFIVGIFVFVLTAFFSSGYHHADEHFQILEFANYKLGNSPASDLPWEFHGKIRPAIQPFIAGAVINSLKFFGIDSPFACAFILRLITAFLAWFIICKISLRLIDHFSTERGKKLFVLMSLFLWFMPYIQVRFSSETWSGILLLLAVLLLLKAIDDVPKNRSLLIAVAGLCLGFSFFVRFQIGFAILGLGAWLLLFRKLKSRQWMVLLGSALVAAGISISVDFWFYGEFVLTPVNYYIVNIIQNKAANWGVSPWWDYFRLFALDAIPPLSIILLFLFFIGSYKSKTGVFTFILVPFVLIHMIIGHKEMRFLFPVVYGFIYLSTLGLDYLIARLKPARLYRYGYVVLIILNVSLLVYAVFTPAQEAVKYYRFVWEYTGNKETTILCVEKSLYRLAGIEVNFYRPPEATVMVFENYTSMNNYLKEHRPDTVLVFLRKPALEYKFPDYSAKRVYTMFPDWLLKINFNNWQERATIWSIYKLSKE